MARYGKIFSLLILMMGLSSCSGNNAGQHFPQAPAKDILTVAATPAFRNINAQSFQQAIWHYPADDGYHNIPIGEALAVNIAKAFPPNAEVSHLTLRQFETECEEGGFLEEDVLCQLRADFAFRLYHHPKSIKIHIPDLNFENLAMIEEQPGYTVSHGRGNAFQQHIDVMLGIIRNRFKRQLSPMLIEANKRQLF